jgi:hypothetical protein
MYLGAKWGTAVGEAGRSYALPTCSVPGVPLSLDEIKHHVDQFLAHARANNDVTYFVSAIATGYAGYTEGEIAPLFEDAPLNCDLPDGWRS